MSISLPMRLWSRECLYPILLGRRGPAGSLVVFQFCGRWFDLQWGRSWYTLLMRPNKVETTIKWFRKSHAALTDFLVMVIQLMIYFAPLKKCPLIIERTFYIYIYIYICVCVCVCIYTGKKLTGDINICRFYQGLRFHTQREDGTNPTFIPKETVAAITILYRNTKIKVRSPDGNPEYFDIGAGVQQGDTLAPYLFIICLDYVLRTSIEKFQRKWLRADKEKKQKVPRKNNYRRRLRRWHSVTGEYTQPSRNNTA